MPVTIMKYVNGKLQKTKEIVNSSGWWNCLTITDLNGDGKPDLIFAHYGHMGILWIDFFGPAPKVHHVGSRAQDPSGYAEPDRKPDDELLAFLAASSAELEVALDGAEPAEPVWTWAPRRDVAFVLRRQVVEAVVHTADLELVLDDLRPIPADVALDAIDEWLEVELPAALPDGPPAGAHPVVLHAVDADAERTLFPGTRPFPIAVLTGNAGDLLLALWRRLGIEILTVDGDPATAGAMLNLVRLE